MSLEDAMLQQGLSPRRYAQSFDILLNKVEKKKDDPKAHLDVLKELGKNYVPPPRTAERASVQVMLVHNVPRPVREFAQQALPQKEPQ